MNVMLTPDMKKADIYISQTNSFNEIDLQELKKGLEKAKGFIRKKQSKFKIEKNSRDFLQDRRVFLAS